MVFMHSFALLNVFENLNELALVRLKHLVTMKNICITEFDVFLGRVRKLHPAD